MTVTYNVRRVTEAPESWIQQATDALDAAFHHRFFSGSLANDKELIFACLRAHVTGGLLEGEVYAAETADGQPVGVSVWFGPGHKFLDSERQRKAGWDQMIEKLPPNLQSWWDQVFLHDYENYAERFYGPGAKRAGYHLQLIGVHPDHQRRRLGSQLMSIVHHEAHAAGLQCFLEAANPTTRGIYKSMGYNLAGTATLKSSGDATFEMHYMAKEP